MYSNKEVNNNPSELTEKEVRYLSKFDYKTSNIYGLPKVHRSEIINEALRSQKTEVITVLKPADLKLRPIIAGPICPTHRLSHFIDIILQPLAAQVNSYVRDNFDVLLKIPTEIDEDMIAATFDVENLYGSITHDVGLEAIHFWLNKQPQDSFRFSNEFIISSIKIILENNIFQFDGHFYKQLKGTAMGTKMAPIYATLTLGYLELKLSATIQNHFSNAIYNNFRKFYFRYLDDILIFFKTSELSIEEISNLLNEMNNNIKFQLESSGSKINFLDIQILINEGKVETDMYCKSTDTKQYLNFSRTIPDILNELYPTILHAEFAA